MKVILVDYDYTIVQAQGIVFQIVVFLHVHKHFTYCLGIFTEALFFSRT